MFISNIEPSMSGEGSAVAIVMIIYLVMMLLSSVFGVLCYVLNSLGSYTIASRRGIKNAWLAWIPVGSTWIMGSISDQYQQVAKGKNKRKRVTLLALELVMYGLLFVVMGSAIVLMVQAMTYGDAMADEQALELVGSMGAMILAYLGIFGVAIAYMIVYYFALYDLYASCKPENAVLYLVLSILIGVVTPFLIFSCRKKDLGMVPPQPQYQPPVYATQPQQPTWQSVQNPIYQPYQPPVQPEQPQYQPQQQPIGSWEQQDQQ